MTQGLILYLVRTLRLVIICCPVQIYGVDSFCIADTVPLGGVGRVSCHFSEDLSKFPQKDLNVYLYGVSNSDPELVVFYSWQNGQPKIVTAPGYDSNNILTDHLDISIYNGTRKHAGVYKCVVAPSKGSHSKNCTLVIEEGKKVDPKNTSPSTDFSTKDRQGIQSFCKAPSVEIGNRGMITCHFTEDLSISPPKDLNVFLQRESDTEEILVLLYAWEEGSPLIISKPGYNFGVKLTNQLEITIDNTTKEHAGLYKCVVVFSTEHQASPCTLHVMEEGTFEPETGDVGTTTRIIVTAVIVVAVVIGILFIAYKKGFLSKCVRNINGNKNKRDRIKDHISDHNAENDLSDKTRTIREEEQSQAFLSPVV